MRGQPAAAHAIFFSSVCPGAREISHDDDPEHTRRSAGDGHLASIVSFVELCGHEKYAKTALFGAPRRAPAFSCHAAHPRCAL